MNYVAQFKEALTGRCRFYEWGCCTRLGGNCHDPDDYRRCGRWKDWVLGPVQREELK